MLINPGVRKVEGLCLPWGWEGRLSFLLFSTPCPIQAGPGGGGCTRAHRGALCRRHRAAGGESAGRRRLPVLPALRGANPKLRGRRPRPSAGPSALGVEGSGRAPPAAAQHFAAAAQSAAGRALETGRRASRWCGSAGARGRQPLGSVRRQRPPAASGEQLRGSPAASRRAIVPERAGEEGRQGGGVASGEVVRALSLSPLPCPLGPLCPGSPWPRRSSRDTGQRGLRSLLGARRRCGENRARWRSGRVVATPQLLRGRVGE